MKTAVIGSGGWGTAIAILLAENGHNVYLWSWQQAETDRLNRDRENKEFLPGRPLHDAIVCSHDMGECVDGAELIVTAVPSPATRTTARTSNNTKCKQHIQKRSIHNYLSIKNLLQERYDIVGCITTLIPAWHNRSCDICSDKCDINLVTLIVILNGMR